MEKTNKFSGNRVALGTMMFIFFAQGVFGVNTGAYALCAENFNVSLTFVGTCSSVMTIVGTLLGFCVTTVSKKIGLRNCLNLAGASILLQGIVVKVVGANPITLVLINVFYGIDLAFGTFGVVTEIVCNWFENGKVRADKIAFNTGAAFFGNAVFTLIAAQVVTRLSLFDYYLVMDVIMGVLMLIIANVFVVSGKPEDVGQKPLPEDKEVLEKAKQQNIINDGKEVDAGPTGSIYTNAVFWFSIIAKILGAAAVNYVALYAAMFFSDIGGVDYSIAVTIASSFVFASSIFSFVSGRVITALKPTKFLVLVYVGGILANLFMIVYQGAPSAIMIGAIILTYALGSGIGTANNLVTPALFSKAQAMNANSKIYAAGLSGFIVLGPLTAFVLETYGYTALYTSMIVLNIISMGCYLLAIVVAKKQGRQVG